MTWQWLNLESPEYDADPQPPEWCGLIYAGGRHMLSGPSESLKTIVAWILALESLRTVTWKLPVVGHLDFEMGPTRTRRLLEDLGADHDVLRSIIYAEPPSPPDEVELVQHVVDSGAHLAIIDAAAGAYGVQGLDDNKRADAEKFARTWVDPFWKHDVATIVIDHVVKRTDERSKYAIGSERKVGQVDVHLGVEVVQQLVRGGRGILKIRTHKDRGGFLPRPYAAELVLHSDPETHRITWEWRQPMATVGEAGWQPTVLMQRVSELLASRPDGASRAEIERNVRGKSNEHKRQAIDELVAAGYATEKPGSRGARMVLHVRPFTSPDLAATSPGEVVSTSPTSPAPTGGEASGEVAGEHDQQHEWGEVNCNGSPDVEYYAEAAREAGA